MLGGELLPKVACASNALKQQTPTSHLTLAPGHLTSPTGTDWNLATLESIAETTTIENTVRAPAQSSNSREQQQSITTTVATAGHSSLGPGSLQLFLTSLAAPNPRRPLQLHHPHHQTPLAPPQPRLLLRSSHCASKKTCSQRPPKKTRPRWPPSRESCLSSSWAISS